MDSHDGKQLNSPNDVTTHPDGSVWFTDPGWGIDGNYEGTKAVKEIPPYVFRVDPTPMKACRSSPTWNGPTASASRPTGRCSTSWTSARSASMTWRARPVNGRVPSKGTASTGSGPIATATCGPEPVGRSRVRRRALLQPRGRAARSDPSARVMREPLLRRGQEEPAVHDRQPLALQRVRRGARGPGALTPGGQRALPG